jgi:hypothetical protein
MFVVARTGNRRERNGLFNAAELRWRERHLEREQ